MQKKTSIFCGSVWYRYPNMLALGALALAGCGGGAPAQSPALGAPPVAAEPALPAGVAVNLDIGAQLTGSASLSPAFSGLSFEKGMLPKGLFSGNNTALISLFRELGPGVLRIGGNSVDKTNWDPNGAGLVANTISPSDVDRLADFLRASGWKIIYGINFATETTDQMAGEAAYAKSRFGKLLAGFELGNEPDLYSRNGLRPTSFTFSQYLNEWNTNASAVRAADPDAVFAGPASSYNYKGYTVPFAQSAGAKAGILTHHYYTGPSCANSSTGYAPSLAGLLAPDPNLATQLQALAGAAGSAGIAGGARMAEANSFYSCTGEDGKGLSGAPGVSDSFASALWVMDFAFANARYGMSGFNMHSGGTAYYSPIQTKLDGVYAVQPEYYGLWLFGQALAAQSGKLMDAKLSMNVQPALQINAYDVLAQDGSHRVVLLNESSSDANVTVRQLPGGASTAAISVLSATGGLADTTAANVSVNGSHVRPDGSWDTVPKPLIRAVANGTTVVHLPAGSAVLAIVR